MGPTTAAYTVWTGRGAGGGVSAGSSSETFTISVAVTVGAPWAGGVRERLFSAAARVGVEEGLEVEAEAGAGGPTDAAPGGEGLL